MNRQGAAWLRCSILRIGAGASPRVRDDAGFEGRSVTAAERLRARSVLDRSPGPPERRLTYIQYKHN